MPSTTSRKIYTLQNLNFLQCCNLKIGILGGSFNPAHAGHLQLSIQALKLFNLDYIIWLVALQNPFKAKYKTDIFVRSQAAATLANHPKILVSTAEFDLKVKYTYQILKYFKDKFNLIEFKWLMGADSLSHFHKWDYSDLIPSLCEIIIFDRPGFSNLFNFSKFASKYHCSNIILHKGIKADISSSLIRERDNRLRIETEFIM